jgi:hypothetical protein
MSTEKWQFYEREPQDGAVAATDLLKNGTATWDIIPFMNIGSKFCSVPFVAQIN